MRETITILEEIDRHLDNAPNEITKQVEERLKTLKGVALELNLLVVP